MSQQREQVAQVLRIIASKEEQRSYADKVPIADVPAELLCMWFNDLGEIWRSDAFDESERNRIEAFNRFYCARVGLIPKSLSDLHQSAAWDEVVRESQQVLLDLGWHSDST